MNLSTLFRKEVFEAKRETWLGRVQVVQPLSVRVVALVSAALLIATAVYLVVGTYTRRVHAAGILVPDRGLMVVASPAAGVISSAAVSEGQKVHKGQLLYVVNLDATSANGPTQLHIVSKLREQRAIIEKERDVRSSMSHVEKQSLAERLENLKQQHSQLKAQIEIQRASVAMLKAKTDQLQSGVQKGLVRDADFQNQNYIRIQAVSQQAQYEQQALQLDGQIDETASALAMYDDKLAREINEISRNLLQLDQMIAENEARRSIEVQAPADGTLTAIRGHAGQQVSGGSPLVTLLPTDGKLTVNLFVDSSAIGFVVKGEPVLLRYAAFPFQRFGLYRGVVREVTRAPIGGGGVNPSQAGQGGQSREAEEATVYRVIVDPEQPYVVAYGERQPLEAGMRVDADVALEKRPLYRWMLDPLYHVHHSLNIITGNDLK